MVDKADPMYGYVDKKIKALKNELSKDTTALQSELLTTQRYLAVLQIRVIHNETATQSKISNTVFTQFVAELATAQKEIESSTTPLSIATAFMLKRHEDFRRLGLSPIFIRSNA